MIGPPVVRSLTTGSSATATLRPTLILAALFEISRRAPSPRRISPFPESITTHSKLLAPITHLVALLAKSTTERERVHNTKPALFMDLSIGLLGPESTQGVVLFGIKPMIDTARLTDCVHFAISPPRTFLRRPLLLSSSIQEMEEVHFD